MSIKNHVLGFPRIGLYRELKFAQEKYWEGKSSIQELLLIGRNIRKKNWEEQIKNKLDFLSVGDFSWYDHVLTTSLMLGNIPNRYFINKEKIDLDMLFCIARGKSFNGNTYIPSEMTKWFNTNYHYIVPEFVKNQKFSFSWFQILKEIDEAKVYNYPVKPILLGPLTYLWLGKIKGVNFNKLDLLQDILKVYKKIFQEFKKKGIDWIQIDEPILCLDLNEEWKKAFTTSYFFFKNIQKVLLTTYFGSIKHNLSVIADLPIQGIHIDLTVENYDLIKLHNFLPKDMIISFGIINGRNIWRSNLIDWFEKLILFSKKRDSFWISSSCSLLHVPLDINVENNLTDNVKEWFSFGYQKCYELFILKQSLNNKKISTILKNWVKPIFLRKQSDIVNNIIVKNRVSKIPTSYSRRKSSYIERSKIQKKVFNLPILPTTTIGSFPQTPEIRKLRVNLKNGIISQEEYNLKIKNYIQYSISQQEKIGLDVLVHGEPERNDMVEYFSEYLEGFVFTSNGWVQSYGSRCVKPPIIIGDISRITPITLFWTKYAQSLTSKPVKGMLTGPVTILLWSFPREDLSKSEISKQIALALQDEVRDLENAGIGIIQIDEPALREGLPLRQYDWKKYLSWATESFRLTTSIVSDKTQIHTHMCYCEFYDIFSDISSLDADVITIETSRSGIEILDFFDKFKYPNEIGPGVYDIHSPSIPTEEWIENILIQELKYLPKERLWVNPDCGLKTRNWKETILSLSNMIKAVLKIRKKFLN